MNRGLIAERHGQTLRIDPSRRRRAGINPADAWEIAEGGVGRQETPNTALERLLIRKGDRWLVVRLAEVDWIGGAGNYVELHIGAAHHLYRQTLGGLEPKLDARRFARIHRSTIVNLDRVAELRPTSSGCYDVTLRDGTHLTLSRRHRKRVLGLVGRG
jgi:two-component system, LytTR family, response regulator